MKGTFFGLCILLITCSTGEGHLTFTNDDSSFNSWLCGLNDWMESMKEWKHRIEQYCSEEDLGTEWKELFSCSEPITVSCCDDTMEHCETNYFNCTICYCTDGKYTNRYRYQQLWKKYQTDFQAALRLYDEKLQNCRRSNECEKIVAVTAQPTNVTTDGVTTKPTNPTIDGVAISPTNASADRLTITPTNATNQEMTTTENPCPVSYDNKCFFADTKRYVNRTEGVAVCENLGGHLANIYSQAHMDDIMNYVREQISNGSHYMFFHVGMTFDPVTNKLSFRDGSEAPEDLKWGPGYPYTGEKYAHWTDVILEVFYLPEAEYQYLSNHALGFMIFVLCEVN